MDDSQVLRNIASSVILTMHQIPQINHLPLEELHRIPLGKLRKDATRLHAVCRFRKGIRKDEIRGPEDVRCVDLHPEAMSNEWEEYAKFLLYHEFLHALGFTGHDRTFRALEALWPHKNAMEMGTPFSNHLRKRTAKWLWTCPNCAKEHPRSKRSRGRYRCRDCRITLIDIPCQTSEPNT